MIMMQCQNTSAPMANATAAPTGKLISKLTSNFSKPKHLTLLDLPQELIDKIIDNVTPSPSSTDSNTQATLRSLATVCRSLRPLAQGRLFRSVTINTRAPPSPSPSPSLSHRGSSVSMSMRTRGLVDGMGSLSLGQRRIDSQRSESESRTRSSGRRPRSMAVKLLDALVDAPGLAVWTDKLSVILDDDDEEKEEEERSVQDLENGDKEQVHSHSAARNVIPRLLEFYCADHDHDDASHLKKFILRRQSRRPQDGTRRYNVQIPLPPPILQAVVRVLGLGSLVHVELKDVSMDILRCLYMTVRYIALWNPQLLLSEQALEEASRTRILSPSKNTQGRAKIESLLIDDAKVTEESGNRNALALGWLLAQKDMLDFTRLKRLRIGLTHCRGQGQGQGHEQVASLLSLCGDSLQELSLSPSLEAFATGCDPETEPITLSILPSLTYLHIGAQTGFWRREDTTTYDPIPWVCSLLRRAASPSLIKTIVLSSSYGMIPAPTNTPSSSPSTSPSHSSSSSSSTAVLSESYKLNLNYLGPNFDSYTALDTLLSPCPFPTASGTPSAFPHLQKVHFHIEEAPYYREDMPPPHTFRVRAKWVEAKIKAGMHMRALLVSGRGAGVPGFEVSSNLFPYSTRLMLDADW